MKQIYSNKSVKFYFNPETGIFRANFEGLVNMKNILEAFDFVIKNGGSIATKAIISDLTKLTGTFTMLIEYMEKNLYPYMAAKGVLADVLVYDPRMDPFIIFSLKKLTKLDLGMKIEVFDDMESAEKWVNEFLQK